MVKKAKKELIADSCISIEKELSKLKLWANLIPLQSFKANLRHIFSRKEWNSIRSAVYKRDEYKCPICSANLSRNDRLTVGSTVHKEQIYTHYQTQCDVCRRYINLLKDID